MKRQIALFLCIIMLSSQTVIFAETAEALLPTDPSTTEDNDLASDTNPVEEPVPTDESLPVDEEVEPEPADEETFVFTSVKATSAAYNKIRLTWKSDAPNAKYEVYQSSSKTSGFKRVKTTKGNNYTTGALTPAKTYYFYIKGTAKATNGKVSEFRSAVIGRAPFGMSGLRVKRSGGSSVISWNKTPSATSYRVYRKYSASGKAKFLKEVKGTTYKDGKAASGKSCYYVVKPVRKVKRKKTLGKSSSVKAVAIYRVFIETGHGVNIHGRWDPGAKWNDYQEAKLVLPISQSMTKYLRKSGVTVYTDAFSGNDINLRKAVAKCNKLPVSAAVHIHCDYYKADAGTLPLYLSAKDKMLATALNNGVHSEIEIADRGLEKRGDLYVLRNTKVPTCLFETGSIKKDNELLRTQSDEYGKGLARGMCQYLGVEFKG